MSAENLKGKIEIEFDESDVVSAAKNTTGAINTMGKAVEKDLDDIGKSATGAADDLTGLGDKGKRSFDKLESGADSATSSVKDTALEVVALGETFSGVAESAFGFAEKLLSVERALVGIEQSALGLTRQIEDFETAIQSGELSLRDQERAVQDIQAVYRDFELQQRELEGQQLALNGEFVSFGLQMLTTITISGIMLKQLGLTNLALVRQKVALLANSRVLKFLKFDLIAARAAFVTTTGAMGVMTSTTRVATFSMAGLRAGIRATMAALGPLGLIMVGIGIAFTVWETNAFGIQERMAELWELLKKFVPTLALLETTVKALFPPEAAQKVDQYGIEIGGLDSALTNVGGQFATLDETTKTYTSTIETMSFANQEAIAILGTGGVGTMDESLTGAFNSLGAAISETSGFVDGFSGIVFDARGNLIDLTKRVGNTNDVYRIWQETLKGVNKQLNEQNGLMVDLKKNQNELNGLEKQSKSRIGDLSDFITAPDGTIRRAPTRQGLVTQEFFNSLSPELRSSFRPTSGPGAAPGTRERLATAKAFRNSVAGIIAQALTGRGGLDRTQSGIAQRNQATISAIVLPIREARARGLSLPPLESETVGGFAKLAAAARAAITRRNEAIFQERVSSFSIISRQLGVSTSLVTRNREETIDIFARLISEDTTAITEQQARLLLARGVDDQSTANRRNGVAHQLAYLNRQQLIQNMP